MTVRLVPLSAVPDFSGQRADLTAAVASFPEDSPGVHRVDDSAPLVASADGASVAWDVSAFPVYVAPPPPPPPPPPQGTGQIETLPINMARVLCFDAPAGWKRTRYDRLMYAACLPDDGPLYVHAVNFDTGGQSLPITGSLSLRVNGALFPAQFSASGNGYLVDVDVSSLADGWYTLEVENEGGPPDQTALPADVYVCNTGDGTPAAYPVATNNSELTAWFDGARPVPLERVYHRTRLPTVMAPTEIPQSSRAHVPFSHAAHRSELFCRHPLPLRPNIARPVQIREASAGDFLCAPGWWLYHYYEISAERPVFPSLDGPRGRGSLAFATDMATLPDGGFWFSDPWRVGKVSADGTVTTVAGWRHASIPPYHQEADDIAHQSHELVGDWTGTALSGFRRARSIAQQGGTLYVADSLAGVVYAVESNGTVTVVAALPDPWGLAIEGQTLYVSCRGDNSIRAIHLSTYSVSTLVDGSTDRGLYFIQNEASSHAGRAELLSPATLTDARDAVVCAPEGLAIHDGKLYVASLVARQVVTFDLAAQDVPASRAVVCQPNPNNRAEFMQLAVSDGTFGPAGTCFVATWDSSGYPLAYLPDGSQWTFAGVSSSARIYSGRGGEYEPGSYSSACGVGGGRLLCGYADDGIIELSLALAGDPAKDLATYQVGRSNWFESGRYLVHGIGGWGYSGILPNPADLSPEEVAYLAVCAV